MGIKRIGIKYIGLSWRRIRPIVPNGAPSGLTLTVISGTEIQLDWTAGSTNHDGHSIERSTDGANFSEIATVTGATVHYHNTGLSQGTLYYYRVRAYKNSQYSSYSNTASDFTIWTDSLIFLFFGETSKITGGKLYNQVSGATDYITVAGSAGSETYQCPNTAAYIAADTDYIWFKTNTSQRTATTAELIGYDLQRTPVKYDDDLPNTIGWIGILKSTTVLTAIERNNLFLSFHLPIMWDNSWNDYGVMKNNRSIIEQILWVPESVNDSATDALVARMVAVGDNQTLARIAAMDTCIKALKANSLFNDQWDVLVILKGKGASATLLNWIKDSSNATGVNSPVYAEDIGYNSDGATSYIRTNYIPSSNASLYTNNDASFVVYMSTNQTNQNSQQGVYSSAGFLRGCEMDRGQNNTGINCAANDYTAFTALWHGINAISRYSSSECHFLSNPRNKDITISKVSTDVPTRELYVLACNKAGTAGGFAIGSGLAKEIDLLYAIGKGITYSKLNTFKGIIDTFFASF